MTYLSLAITSITCRPGCEPTPPFFFFKGRMSQVLHEINEAKALWKTSRDHVTNDCITTHLHKQPSFARLILNFQSEYTKTHFKAYLQTYVPSQIIEV